MSTDGELLQKFAETRDEASFAEIVRRYIGFVHAVSLRRLRDPHAAEDATQAVFVALARKAASVAQAPSVMGWLHRSTCYETHNLMRAQAHRLARENEAAQLGTTYSMPAADNGALEAVLDEALDKLSETDRGALLARFFSGYSYAQIGTKLRLTENTARMRVDRALEKLRVHLLRKGITCSAAAVATALPACAATPVTASMAATITSTSIANAAVISGTTSIFAIMGTTKIITGTVVVAAVAALFYQAHKSRTLEARPASLKTELPATAEKQNTLQQQVSPTDNSPLKLATATQATPSPAASSPSIWPKTPEGWRKNGSANNLYEVGVDETKTWGGMPSAYAKSTGEADGKFGGMMQTISTDNFRNQRVRLTGWIKTESATDGANLWMRVDGENGKTLSFDNMADRAPKGTTDWEEYSVVLDVPETSSSLNYGFFVQGKGKMWVNGLTLTPVGAEAETTDMYAKAKKNTHAAPVNLGFNPN